MVNSGNSKEKIQGVETESENWNEFGAPGEDDGGG